MPEWDQARIASVVASMLGGNHGIEALAVDDTVLLTELNLKIVTDEPIWHSEGRMVQLPIAVGDPSWAAPAWDQAVGVRSPDEDPIGQALMAWTHHVLPLFIALRLPGHPLAEHIHREGAENADGSAAEILAGPLMMRRFSEPPPQFDEVLSDEPPTLRVARRLLAEFTVGPDPIWLYTLSGRSPSPVTEITVNNALWTDRYPGFDEHLPWGRATGTVKSWAVIRPVPN